MGLNQRTQIAMTDDEVAAFLERSRVLTMGTIGPTGTPHLTAMWFGLIDGEIWFETKAKSQKATNLRRDDRITCMVEDGLTYDALRGVAIEGRAEIIDDHDQLFAVARSVWERYTGPYTDDLAPAIEALMNKRVAVRVRPERIRSWDHRKLGLPEMPIGGSTAQFL
ncbi:pyridoxamine 5'-phosphate oxidase family protein [Antrihabitans cavernicola]|uniref:PPOX class F420-dependent oxidoreductase n=1 Tax=Antrihabitans cavernicola TaxID=2495913 RepID=A0A5A7SI08_9NOCA|nr:PPOX class F420-dependent oxidoreductase [Spelaeibacter cavernicola]KAA0024233.1 PPOX class F420-dependent oxidoreductase [Spelaeibacter cavernicola]